MTGPISNRWIVLLLLGLLALALAVLSLFGAVVLGSDEASIAKQFGAFMLGSLCVGILLLGSSLVSFVGRRRAAG